MQIEIEKETSKRIERVSKLLGVKKQDIVDRAITVYLDSISKYTSLKKEISAWDITSDEALLNFEKKI